MKIRVEKPEQKLTKSSCPECGKTVSVRGLRGHLAWAHGRKSGKPQDEKTQDEKPEPIQNTDTGEKQEIPIPQNAEKKRKKAQTQESIMSQINRLWFDTGSANNDE